MFTFCATMTARLKSPGRSARKVPVPAALVLCASVAACAEETKEAPREPFELTCGAFDHATGEFTALAGGDDIALIRGFQGLIFINLALRADDPVPQRAQAEATVTFRRDSRTFSFRDNQVYFDELADGTLVSTSFRVPFDDQPSALVNHTIYVALDVVAGDFEAQTVCEVTIVDSSCVHQPDGSFECP